MATLDQFLSHDLEEAQSEIARHHRDFEQIRWLVDEALKLPSHDTLGVAMALKAIQAIVG